MILLQGMEKTIIDIRVQLTETAEKVLHFGPARIAVGRAGGFHQGQAEDLCHMLHMAFRQVNQGPDNRDTGAAHDSAGMEGMETAFIEQGHEEGFDGILPVMAQGQFVTAKLHTGVRQHSPAHF